MIRLIVKFNGSVIKELETDQQEITIGRNADNDLQIDNITVSGRHARILRENNNYIIEDRQSTNGTFVNERKVNRRVLREKDLITIGKHSIAVSFIKFGVHARGENISDLEKTHQLDLPPHLLFPRRESRGKRFLNFKGTKTQKTFFKPRRRKERKGRRSNGLL